MSKKLNPVRSDAERMLALFDGNKRSSGRYDPKRERAFTEAEPLTVADFEKHLAGTVGCGSVPIQDDGTCSWGAIDIDNHGSDEDLDLAAVDRRIMDMGLPLIPCRSKSGGIHCYMFLEQPLPASRVKALLTGFALNVGHGGSEIFPKQGKLGTTKEGKLQLGNWINLPYMDAAKTMRYAMREGRMLNLSEFLDLAEKRTGEALLRALSKAEHPDAPPCVQKMYSQGVAKGHRNEALYNVVIYLKKAYPDGTEAKAVEANQTIFSTPLPRAEFGRTVSSACRPDMHYRCGEEPARSLCDRDACLTRKYGITPEDSQRIADHESLPEFSGLVKYLSEPVRWEFKVDGVKVVNIQTPDLLDWRRIREICAERLTKVVPMIKNQEWERILSPLMKEARIIETPDDASKDGVIRDRLREFASKTDLMNRGEDHEDRKSLLRGLPVVQVVDGDRCVVFRGQDFINFLKRTKSEELKGVDLWMAVKSIGVTHTRMRVGSNANINVWTLPVAMVLEHVVPLPRKEFKSEL